MTEVHHSREAILEQARKITSSGLFENAGRSRALLDYLVQEAVSGRADRLKEYTIGSEGLGRGDSFDPRTDTIVRAEASRLRSRLERYYAAEGKADPLVIVLPRGSYVPDFRERDTQSESAGIVPVSKPGVGRLRWAMGGVAILCLIGLVSWKWNRLSKPVEPPLLTFEVELKVPGVVGSVVGTDVVISPDGTRLVFASQGSDGVSHLNVHQLDRSQTRELPGTEGARAQFLSPDGRWVGFWSAGRLKKTPLDGGSPVVLFEASDLQGASWAEDDSIVAACDSKLWRIPASGGAPRLILDVATDAFRPSAPQVLRGQNAVLFTTVGRDPAQSKIAVHSFSTGKTKVVAQGSTYGRYLPAGYLTYIRQGTLYAAPFDLHRLETTGAAVPILDGVSYDSTFGHAQLDFSQTGTLVYRKSGGATVQWLDETGRTEPILSKANQFVWPRLSPVGSQLAVTTIEGGVATVWIHDLTTRQVRRAATGPMHFSLWSPDGRYLVLGGGNGLAWIRADQPGTPQTLTQGGMQIPASFTRDGSRLAFHALDASTHFDLWTVPIKSSDDRLIAGQPKVFLRTPAIETYPMFSPDGHWLAYASNESGKWEVYVRSFPDRTKSIKISTGGGRVPRWSPTGRELFYRTDNHKIMMATYATNGGLFTVEHVRQWSAMRLFDTGVLANYDVGRDGRIAVLLPADNPEDRQSENHVTIMLNFFEQLRRQVSSSGGRQ